MKVHGQGSELSIPTLPLGNGLWPHLASQSSAMGCLPVLLFFVSRRNVRVRSRNFGVNLDELPVAVGAARALLFSREGTMFTAPSVPCARSVGVNRKRFWDIEVLEDFLWVGESTGTAVCACALLMPVSCGRQSRGSPVHWVKLYWLSVFLPPQNIIKLYLNIDYVFSTVKIDIAVFDNNNKVNAKSNGSHDTDPDTPSSTITS